MVLDSEKGVERHFDIFSRLLRERIVFFTEEVNISSVSILCAQLLHLESVDPVKPIQLYINSPGGHVEQCLSLIDIMEYISCPIYTIGSGLVASAAAVILACGDKRFATHHCRIMIHQVSSSFQGKFNDLLVEMKEVQKATDVLVEILSQKTGKTKEQILKDIEKDKFFSAEEAKEYGLITNVLPRRLKKKTLPDIEDQK